MTSTGGWRDGTDGSDSDRREPGVRRKKLAGYLKAANDLRQTYQQSYVESWRGKQATQDVQGLPGTFPAGSFATASHGDQEMLIFPSYARRHVKKKPSAIPGTIQEAPGQGRDVRDSLGSGDAEFWRQEWDKYEDDKAVVDVDVRGWVFTPQSGPLNRRNRLFVGLARQMVGIPAPSQSQVNSAAASRSSSPTGLRQKVQAHNKKEEEELVAKEAESLLRLGEAEAAAAGEGVYSEIPDDDSDGARARSRERNGHGRVVDDPEIKPLRARQSWNTPAQMSPTELTSANTHLMTRLKPFMANPLATMPISAFFYDEGKSRQKTVHTDAYGHFNLRASLDFVPTHVRVLVSEKLSATEEISITEPQGISVISDVDDTVKHSGIGSGAREIFRNVFIRDLGELTIQGVKDLYQRLAAMNVRFHYVSNSPWQLYPLLSGFFAAAGLPAGSFHLKQYSGMLQGIFEPVAERKKGTLERILRDFPKRRFILFGDSGEADLEVYTDLVCEHPGRVLGIFIRDVTTPPDRRRFFDSSTTSLQDKDRQPASRSDRPRRTGSCPPDPYNETDDPDMRAAIAASLEGSGRNGSESTASTVQSPEDEGRPPLPARRKTDATPQEEDLIDLDYEDLSPVTKSPREQPTRPPKPSNLRTASEADASLPRKSAPPIPPKKPSITPSTPSPLQTTISQEPPPTNDAKPRKAPPPPPQRGSYRLAARERLSAAYEHMPSMPSMSSLRSSDADENEHNPPLPPRKPAPPPRTSSTSYVTQAKNYASSLYTSATAASSSDSLSQQPSSSAYGATTDPAYQNAPVNKKAELWKRRWQRALMILADDNVVMKTWRSGTDVLDEAVRLVQEAQEEEEEERNARKSSREKGGR